ncbi:unnamed protein product [Menidia menidia]|uniref:Uridylate-specific endoribonuclease n=1 Tax=Menidia menidia TaxID=238744 RepID=A0A8S4BF74_9TELE|nr:unnamed protein product [Menidia menidia]
MAASPDPVLSRPAVNQELSDLFNELWRLDANRMKPGTDYTLSVQGRAGFVSQGSHVVRDHASQPLFSSVDEVKLRNATTFSREPMLPVPARTRRPLADRAGFMGLLDNYERSTGVMERVTPEELAEVSLFLDAVLETEVMKPLVKEKKRKKLQMYFIKNVGREASELQRGAGAPVRGDQHSLLSYLAFKRAHQYLVSKGQSSADLRQFKNQLNLIWFHLYHRQRNAGLDSCGFEHVFVGEMRSGTEIIGFHNWIQFYLQEKNRHLDYKGYKARENDLPDHDDHVLNMQFSWHGLVKPVGSAFIGTSPEFEMALFTVVFLMNTERSTTVLVNVDQCQMELVVVRHGRSLGTAYPKLLSSNSRHVRQPSH